MSKKSTIFFVFLLVVTLGLMVWYSNTHKPIYDSPQKALSYMWNKTQDDEQFPYGCRDITLGKDSNCMIIVKVNYRPASNRKMFLIFLNTKEFAFEYENRWYVEEDGIKSKEFNLRSMNEEEKKLIKLVYEHFY